MGKDKKLNRKFESAKTAKPENKGPEIVEEQIELNSDLRFAAELAVGFNQRCRNEAQELRTRADMVEQEGAGKLRRLAQKAARSLQNRDLPPQFNVVVDVDAGVIKVAYAKQDE